MQGMPSGAMCTRERKRQRQRQRRPKHMFDVNNRISPIRWFIHLNFLNWNVSNISGGEICRGFLTSALGALILLVQWYLWTPMSFGRQSSVILLTQQQDNNNAQQLQLQQFRTCPFGWRQSQLGGVCDTCVPGMIGPNCTDYHYAQLRQTPSPTVVILPEAIRLLQVWLEQETLQQHILEFGISTMSSSSSLSISISSPQQQAHQHQGQQDLLSRSLLDKRHSTIRSVVAMDPWMPLPTWTRQGVHPTLRLLPCQPNDVLEEDGLYFTPSMARQLAQVTTWVCQQCDQRVSSWMVVPIMLQRTLPRVTTMLLEGSNDDNTLLDQIATAILLPQPKNNGIPTYRNVSSLADWEIVSDIRLTRNSHDHDDGAQQGGHHDHDDAQQGGESKLQTRRLMLLKKKKQLASKSSFPKRVVPQSAPRIQSSSITTSTVPFELFRDYDLTERLRGNETWADLIRYRRELPRPTLGFYLDKVAQRRWLQWQGIATPETFLLHYDFELPGAKTRQQETIRYLSAFLTRSSRQDLCSKPTHLSCSDGTWLTKHDPITNNTWTRHHGTDLWEFHDDADDSNRQKNKNVPEQVAESLARDLHSEFRCGNQTTTTVSWAQQTVNPGVMMEARFDSVEAAEHNSGAMVFKVITIWGRVWMAQWQSRGLSNINAFLHRNGTAREWPRDEDEGTNITRLPEWVDWLRIVDLAERLGEHKDMFQTDILVGIPAGSPAIRKEATREERLTAVEYVVSEMEIHPPQPLVIKGAEAVFQQGGQLWLAGYKSGNYKVVPNSEVPTEFVEKGIFTGLWGKN
jgi:hypothetical protein